jgi:hypothetical protein
MTIRIRPSARVELFSARNLAALLTPTLLRELRDDAPDGTAAAKPGTAWLRWSSGHSAPIPGLD